MADPDQSEIEAVGIDLAEYLVLECGVALESDEIDALAERAIAALDQVRTNNGMITLVPTRTPPKTGISQSDIRIGGIYKRRDGRIMRVTSYDGSKWGKVRFDNLNRTGRVPPSGNVSAHYWVQEIIEILEDAQSESFCAETTDGESSISALDRVRAEKKGR